MNKITLKFVLSHFLFLLVPIINAQVTTFQKNYTNGSSNSIEQTTDGGYISVGATNSFGAGGFDVYLIKTSSSGNILWTKSYGGLGDENGQSVKKTSDGGFIITGYTNSFGAGNDDVILIKIDSIGNIGWTKTFGGPDNDYGHSVFQDTDNGFIISGETTSFGNFGGTSNYEDFYLIKTDSLGNLLWTKIIGGTSKDYCNTVRKTSDGGFFLIGETYSFGAGIYDVYVTKTDSIGNVLWSKTYGGSYWDLGYSGLQTNDGGYLICGTTRSFGSIGDLYLLKTDGIGNLLWSKTISVIGNSDGTMAWSSDTKCTSIQQTIDGGYIIAGDRDTMSGPGQDIFLIKTDSIGNIIKAKIYNNGGGGSLKKAYSVLQTNDGGFILSGIDYDLGITYLIKTDSNCSSGCFEYDVLTTTTNPLTIETSQTTLDTSGGITNTPVLIMTNGSSLATDMCATVGIDEQNNNSEINIAPNPFNNQTIISFNEEQKHSALKITDVLGKEVRSINFSGKQLIIEKGEMQPGIYFVKIFDGKKIYDKKIVVQ